MAQDITEAAGGDSDKGLSRREFGAASVAAGIAVTASAGAAHAAVETTERAVDIKTPDGICDAILVSGKGAGPKPAVILYPDAGGLRPVMVDMAKRLAGHGYTVLVINQFYRTGRAPVFPPTMNFANPDDRAKLMALIGTLDHASVTRDATAFIAFLDTQPEVAKKAKIGSVGFCMGGSMTVRTAAVAPDRVGAAVSFHGGSLVTEDPNSPHKLLEKTKAAYHIGIAAGDDEKDPQTKVTFEAALKAAKCPYTLEVYPGSKHGWMVPGSPVYDEAQAERGWAAMLATYKAALV